MTFRATSAIFFTSATSLPLRSEGWQNFVKRVAIPEQGKAGAFLCG
jgi:hypothetical protein